MTATVDHPASAVTPPSLRPDGDAPARRHTPDTPLADALLTLARRGLTSFHALPLSHGDALRGSAYRDAYRALYGAEQLAADVSYSGHMLDSFFRPHGPLLQAQRLAARAFGADHTFFLSCGTSITNRVALGALTRPGQRVLADRSCHQSVHFALPGLGVDVDYAPLRACCDACPREFADLPRLLEMFERAAGEGRPYDTVVLSAVSYDGVRYNLPAVLGALADIRPDVRVVVDEAWAAAHTFHPYLRPLTALHAGRMLRHSGKGRQLELIVTHSAHKSLAAPRQGSYLHVLGSDETRERCAQELFRQHTTSPSWPVLTGLDLARAQAETEGEALLERSLRLARRVRDEIGTDPELDGYAVLDPGQHLADRSLLVADDPTRVLIDLGGLGIPAGEFRQILFEEYDIYLARDSGSVVLLHLHIGVDEPAVRRLLDAMRTIRRSRRRASAALSAPDADQFVIAYPPGVPIAVPGERVDDDRRDLIASLLAEGREIYTLQGTAAVPSGD